MENQGKTQQQRNDSSLFGCLAFIVLGSFGMGYVIYLAMTWLIQLF